MLVKFLNRVKSDKTYYFGEMDIDEQLANTFINNGWAESMEFADEEIDGERKVSSYDIMAMNRRELRTLAKAWGLHTGASVTVAELHEMLLKQLEVRKNGGNG